MAIVKEVKKAAKKILVLAIIVVIVIIGYKLLTAEPAIKPAANNIIQLQSITNPLDKAKLISSTDILIKKMKNTEVEEQWEKLTNCLNTGCEDKKYFDFLIILFTQYKNKLPKSDLLMNVLAVQRYWGANDVLTFSKAMSYVDAEIEKTQSRSLKKKWDEIIQCNRECSDYNSLFLKLIQLILT